MYRAGESNLSNGLCALLGISGSIGYVMSSMVSGKVVNQKNCKSLLLVSSLTGTILCLIMLFSTNYLFNLLLLFVFSAANGLFFNAFQSFMRNSSSRGKLMKIICMYTIAWSGGISLGYLASGSLYKLGPYALSIIVILSGAWVLWIFRKDSSIEANKETEDYAFSKNVMFVWIGWIIIAVVTFVERSILVFFPVFCAQKNIGPFYASLPLFLMMFGQGVFSIYFIKNTRLFYNKNVIILANIAAAIVMLSVWLFPSYLVYIIGFILLGLYGSFTYFSAVFYANNHFENRSLNVGINETIVGMSSITGVAISYIWMKALPGPDSIYLGCALLLIILVFVILFFPVKSRVNIRKVC